MNLGSIANDKVRLQNTADFSALSGSVWQARGMNLEALFNKTVTISIAIEIAKCIFTGTPPTGLPPKWIELQMDAQQWIQEGFNKYWFGTGMVVMNGLLNGELTIPKPYKVPLYVYRYSFAAAVAGSQEDADTDGASALSDKSNAGVDKYSGNSKYDDIKATSDKADEGKEDTGAINWDKKYTLVEKEGYPYNLTDKVPLILGDQDRNDFTKKPDKLDSTELMLNETMRKEITEKMNGFVEYMIDQNLNEEASGLNANTIAKIKESAKKQLTEMITNGALFTYPPSSEDAKIELPYIEYSAGSPMAAILFRVLPYIEFGFILKEGRPDHINEQYNTRANIGLKSKEFIETKTYTTRWYDKVAVKEFKELQKTNPSISTDKSDPLERSCGEDCTETYYEYNITVTCPICEASRSSGWSEYPQTPSLPGGCAKHSGYGQHQKDCIQRTWFYPTLTMEFNVNIKVDLNIDLSAILMGKYRGPKDYCQIKDEKNDNNKCVKEVVNAYWHDENEVLLDKKNFYGRELYVMALQPGGELPFGNKLMAMDPNDKDFKLSDDIVSPFDPDKTRYNLAIEEGRVPAMFAFSSGEHWQRGDPVKENSKPGDSTLGNYYNKATVGNPVYYDMSWRGAPYVPDLKNKGSQAHRDEKEKDKFLLEKGLIKSLETLLALVRPSLNGESNPSEIVQDFTIAFNISDDDTGQEIDTGEIEGDQTDVPDMEIRPEDVPLDGWKDAGSIDAPKAWQDGETKNNPEG